jgi:hypothetical protein
VHDRAARGGVAAHEALALRHPDDVARSARPARNTTARSPGTKRVMPWTVCVRSPTVPPGWTTVMCDAARRRPSSSRPRQIDRRQDLLVVASQSDFDGATSTTAT